MVKKILLIILSCVFIFGSTVCLSACNSNSDSNGNKLNTSDQIVGTWLCEDDSDNMAYYVEITTKENDKYNLDWKMYLTFDWSGELYEKQVADLAVNSKIKGKYQVFIDFKSTYNMRDFYSVELTAADTFIVNGTYKESTSTKELKLTFSRTTLTKEEFTAQYVNK